MASELAFIDILRDDATIGALVGGTGTSARVYPMERPHKISLPAVTVTLQDIEPNDTKDGVSTLDVEIIKVEYYDSTYKNTTASSGAFHLAETGRTALDRVSGTFSNVEIQSARFTDQDMFTIEINNNLIYVVEHEYSVRVVR